MGDTRSLDYSTGRESDFACVGVLGFRVLEGL